MSIDDFSYPENKNELEKKKKKREQEKREIFLQEQAILRESNSLLQKLAKELADTYGISLSEAKSALEGDSQLDLHNLQDSLGNKLGEEKLQKLLVDIQKAQENIREQSISLREKLKSSLAEELNPDDNARIYLTKLFPKRILSRAKEPQNIYDNIIGIGIGTIDSGEAIVLMSYELGKGAILSPYHLYLLLSGKAVLNGKGHI